MTETVGQTTDTLIEQTTTVHPATGIIEKTTVIEQHTQEQTFHVLEFYPSHEPREGDRHYPLFEACRHKLSETGKLVCWIGNPHCSGGIELHHSEVEFALANGVDVGKFEETYPGLNVHDEEEFLCFVEGEGNLLPLCKYHHTGMAGIHCLPYPMWKIQKVWMEALPEPGRRH